MELPQYDVGRYSPDPAEARSYPNYQPVDGEKFPTLEAMLLAHRADACEAELWIELKTTPFDRTQSSDPNGLLTAVLSLVEEFELASRTVLLAFEWQLLIDARAACSEIGSDFLTLDPAPMPSLKGKNGAARLEDMYLPFDPSSHDDDFPGTIGRTIGRTVAVAAGH